ncbi:conserved hypothetical protein [Thiobacillus denitrificans ATCC 25259]|uniref:Glutamate--cysteine ligase n=1 Tax=Thiobacillus denitrificans (strain ATCC 25259 / T1) TaxID=292415 RepID=Q3SIW8_THIDA|nr:glutamate-cysteine ligase family protein [Thiobacillus denitrificans]AAZ97407.1 conserved hypothetical protein [Thiobacillus denitrificans ATCC 25259]
MNPPALDAFAGYGVELEYMVVARDTLAVLPIADRLLASAAGRAASAVVRGGFGWCNEIVLHLVEIKNQAPAPALAPLAAGFQAEVAAIGQFLQPLGARLMPTGMHPWMDPRRETRLWADDPAGIYRAYDRIFDCHSHGQANLQSMQLNLPFADDTQFARLHAAIRLVLPILPAIAASSPLADGRPAAHLDARMAAYAGAVARVPAVIGELVPDTATGRADYVEQVLAPMYRAIAPLDPDGVLQHEWLNARGAIPRFERDAIEIRVVDMQECPAADLAIAAATAAAVRALYDATWSSLSEQQAIATPVLTRLMHACVRYGDAALIDDGPYLRLLGLPAHPVAAAEVWQHLIETTGVGRAAPWREPLQCMQQQGPLARRILRALGADATRQRQHAVYEALCDCLDAGRMFTP